MELKEIRAAYREILTAYSELMDPPMNKGRDDGSEGLEIDGCIAVAARRKLERTAVELKRAADQSGNCQTWKAGESIDGLSQGMKARIEQAMKFGI